MPDIPIVQIASLDAITLDWLLTPDGGLDDAQQLATAAVVALGTDRRANADDQLPNIGDDDRRGWWGDLDGDTIWGTADPIGCRLWLLSRAKITDQNAKRGATVTRVQQYVEEALKYLIDIGAASKLTVTAARTGIGSITAFATIYRGPKSAIQLQFQDLWDQIGA